MKISKIVNQAENFYKKALWSYFLKKVAVEEESYEMDFPEKGDGEYDFPETSEQTESDEDVENKLDDTMSWLKQQYAKYMTGDGEEAATEAEAETEAETEVAEETVPLKPVPGDTKTILAELNNAKNIIKDEVAQTLIGKLIKAFEKIDNLKIAFFENPEMTDKQFIALISNARENFIGALNDLNQNDFFNNPKEEDWKIWNSIDFSPEQFRMILDAVLKSAQNTISTLSGDKLDEKSALSGGFGPEDTSSEEEIQNLIKEETTERGMQIDDVLSQQAAKKTVDAAKKMAARRARIKERIKNNETIIQNLAKQLEQGLIGQDQINAAKAEYVAARKSIEDIERGKKEFDQALRDHIANIKEIKRSRIRFKIIKSNPLMLSKERARKAADERAKSKKYSPAAILDILSSIQAAREKNKELEAKANSLYEKEKDKPYSSQELIRARGDVFRNVEAIQSLLDEAKILKEKREDILERKYKSNIAKTERRGKHRHITSSGTLGQIISSMYEHPKNVEWGDIKKSVDKIKNDILEELDKAQTEIIANFDKAISENKYAPLLETYKDLVKARADLKSEIESVKNTAKELEKSSLRMMTQAISSLLKDEVSRQNIFSSWMKDVEKIVSMRSHIEKSYEPFIDLRVKLEKLKQLGIADQSNESIIAGIKSGAINIQDVENTLQKLIEYGEYASTLADKPFLTRKGKQRINTKPILEEAARALKLEVERFSSLLNTLR